VNPRERTKFTGVVENVLATKQKKWMRVEKRTNCSLKAAGQP